LKEVQDNHRVRSHEPFPVRIL